MISNNPGYIFLHCGPNELRQDISSVQIENQIIAVSRKSDKCNILMSGIEIMLFALSTVNF